MEEKRGWKLQGWEKIADESRLYANESSMLFPLHTKVGEKKKSETKEKIFTCC